MGYDVSCRPSPTLASEDDDKDKKHRTTFEEEKFKINKGDEKIEGERPQCIFWLRLIITAGDDQDSS